MAARPISSTAHLHTKLPQRCTSPRETISALCKVRTQLVFKKKEGQWLNLQPPLVQKFRMEFTKFMNPFGTRGFSLHGYCYQLDKRPVDGRLYWRCLEDHCSARMQSNSLADAPAACGDSNHTHAPKTERGLQRSCITQIKAAARSTTTLIPQIFSKGHPTTSHRSSVRKYTSTGSKFVRQLVPCAAAPVPASPQSYKILWSTQRSSPTSGQTTISYSCSATRPS